MTSTVPCFPEETLAGFGESVSVVKAKGVGDGVMVGFGCITGVCLSPVRSAIIKRITVTITSPIIRKSVFLGIAYS
jgi:hypothetical protein